MADCLCLRRGRRSHNLRLVRLEPPKGASGGHGLKSSGSVSCKANPQLLKNRSAMGPSPTTAGLVPVTEDTPVDMLAGGMFISTYLPDGRVVQTTIGRSTAMMDILVRFTTEHGLAPGDHMMHALDSRGQPLPYKPSTPLGALDVWSIHIVAKSKAAPTGGAHPNNFQHTFRLKVNLPRNQLYVVRVSPLTRFGDILKLVSRDKNLDSEKYVLRHPDDLSIILSSLLRICDYEDLTEVTLVSKEASRSELMKLMEQRQQQRRRANAGNAYTNPVLRHYRQTTASSTVNSQSTEGSGVSTESGRSPSPTPPPAAPLPPARPARKRRPAPRPPPQKEPATTNTVATTTRTTTLTEKTNSNTTTVHHHHHSRESSDSSGYHEPASLVSCSPNNTDTSPTCTLPRKQPTGRQISLHRPLSTPGDVKLSQSLSSLANTDDAGSAGSTGSLSNITTLPRKKKAAPPPPPPRAINKTISEPVITAKPEVSSPLKSPVSAGPGLEIKLPYEPEVVVASPAPVPRPRNLVRAPPPQPPPRSSPFGVGTSLVRLSSSTTDLDDDGGGSDSVTSSTNEDFDEDLDSQLDMDMFTPASSKISGDYYREENYQDIQKLNSVNREHQESNATENLAATPSGDASEDEGAGDSEIIDWEYRLPSPPSAFRDISAGTRSPTLWTDATVPLADTQVFQEEEEESVSLSPPRSPVESAPSEDLPIPGSNGTTRLNPLYNELSYHHEINQNTDTKQLSKSLVDLRFDNNNKVSNSNQNNNNNSRPTTSIALSSSSTKVQIPNSTQSKIPITKVLENNTPRIPKELSQSVEAPSPVLASQIIAADQAQFKMPKLSNFKLTTYDGEAHRRRPPLGYTESNTGATTVVRTGSFGGDRPGSSTTTIRKNINVAPASPENEQPPTKVPISTIIPPSSGLFQRNENYFKNRELTTNSKPAQRSMSTRLPGDNSIVNHYTKSIHNESRPIVRTKSIGSLYIQPGEDEDVLDGSVTIRKAASQTALNKTETWKNTSTTWQEELQSLAVLRTILPTLQQSSKVHDIQKNENLDARPTVISSNNGENVNTPSTTQQTTTIAPVTRWQPPSVALSTWSERARGHSEKETSSTTTTITSSGSTTTVRIVDVKKKSPAKSESTNSSTMGNFHTTVMLQGTNDKKPIIVNNNNTEPAKNIHTYVVKSENFKVPGNIETSSKSVNSVVFRNPRAPVVKGFRPMSTAVDPPRPPPLTNRHSVPDFNSMNITPSVNINGNDHNSINIKSYNNFTPTPFVLNNKQFSSNIKKVAQVSPQSRSTTTTTTTTLPSANHRFVSMFKNKKSSTVSSSSVSSSSDSQSDLLSAIRDFGGIRNLKPTTHRLI